MKLKGECDGGNGEVVLGLDIGAASIGWALVQCTDGKPQSLIRAGVRAFDAGVEGVIETGRDQSRAAKRREARLRRRMLARRRHRLTKLALVLQRGGLLPPGDLRSPEATLTYFQALDGRLLPQSERRARPHTIYYHLRARALEEALTPSEVGRALYHLAQRRGFLSNRKTTRTSGGDKDEGIVKGAIAHLQNEMDESGARTVGEYLSGLDPRQERIRARWLGRGMLEDEFHVIWAAQMAHHPTLMTEDLRQRAHQAIFFQRPLKSQRHLIGDCELERGQRRAPLALLIAQRFRLLQKANDLQVVMSPWERRGLTTEERTMLVDALEANEHLAFGAIRRLLELPRQAKFNFETEGEKGLPGNRTARRLAAVFGEERWGALTLQGREQVVEELRSVQNDEALKRRAMRLWDLDEDAALRLSQVALDDDYCNLSRRALEKIVPLMEQGVPFATARKQVYGDQPPPRALAALPALDKALAVRNPAVERALTELRKLVNAIVAQHGRPDVIRIELARDLKKSRKDRKEIAARNATNRRSREDAARAIMERAGLPNPRRSDIEKWLLAEECGWICPYTGKGISVEALFGDSPQFDVEHIIPFPRCLDDSFTNKTVCEVAENRNHKRKRTPWEAYHDEPRWEAILQRVKSFRGPSRDAKLRRFQLEDLAEFDDFTSQQLNDTRYASVLASRYAGLLYAAGAGGVDPQGRRRVQAGRGQVTGYLRSVWGLNAILGAGVKTRDDHRQHAIDAVVVALTDAASVKRLSDAAERAPAEGRHRFGGVESPWPSFLDDVRAAIDALIVSHRVSRKVAGAIHEETVYSKPHEDGDGKSCVHVRKRVEDLSEKDVRAIVDPAIRACVVAKLDELGVKDPAKAFKSRENHPALCTKEGGLVPIHKARIRRYDSTAAIGGGANERQVKLGSNHHVEILAVTDGKGRARWDGVVVSTYEAMRRLKAHQPVVQRDHGPDKEFLFSLAGGEVIQLDAEDSEGDRLRDPGASPHGLYVVEKVTLRGQGESQRVTVGIVSLNDARKSTGGDKDTVRTLQEPSPEVLRKRGCRKVLITPLGEVRWARD